MNLWVMCIGKFSVLYVLRNQSHFGGFETSCFLIKQLHNKLMDDILIAKSNISFHAKCVQDLIFLPSKYCLLFICVWFILVHSSTRFNKLYYIMYINAV